MTFIYRLFPFLLICSFAFSCKKSSSPDDGIELQTITSFKATLNGANAGTTSSAIGNFTGSYNRSTQTLEFTLNYTGLVPTAWHIHNSDNGIIVFSLGSIVPSPLQSSVSGFSAQEEDDLFQNKYYINIHTAAYPGGEISGIITKQ